jgi:hypothetical protein
MARDKNTRSDLAEKLEALVPKSLDDVIRKNRDRAKIYLSTAEEIAALHASDLLLNQPSSIKGILRDWSYVTIKVGKMPGVFLLGYSITASRSLCTSLVVGIADNLVRTRSGSLYKLEGPATDQPDLLHLCSQLWNWGVGESLGVPHIFY